MERSVDPSTKLVRLNIVISAAERKRFKQFKENRVYKTERETLVALLDIAEVKDQAANMQY